MINEDVEIRAAIQAVASYAAGAYKRDLVRQMTEETQEEINRARLDGKPIDTSSLFKSLAERYAN